MDGAYSFTLADLPNYSEFGALYDQYRITHVRAHFVPHQNTCPVGSAAATTANIIIVPDYDDDTTINLSAILQYQKLTIKNFCSEFTFDLKPMIAVGAYSGAFTSYLAMEPGWIDLASTGVKHYGMKYVIPQVSANNISGWRLYLTYTVEMRQVR